MRLCSACVFLQSNSLSTKLIRFGQSTTAVFGSSKVEGMSPPASWSTEIRTFVESFPVSKKSPTSGSSRLHRAGLTVPLMRNYVKDFQQEKRGEMTYDLWETTLNDLYRQEAANAEEVFIAGFILGQYAAYRKKLPLDLLFHWIGNLEGWAEVDVTCQSNFSAREVLDRWDEGFSTLAMNDLVKSPCISHQRASLVVLIRPLRESADERLLEAVLHNVEILKLKDPDKLITKAISWVLRTSLKHHQNKVYQYVQEQEISLPAFAVKEFRSKFETGTKTKRTGR